MDAKGALAVRPMRHDDLPRVMELDRAAGWRHDRDRFQYLLEDEETRGLVAEVAGADGAVGFAFAGVREPAGWLGAVAADPTYRRRGVGTALCAAADRHLRQHPGCDAALLEALTGNAPAIAIYTRLGFVATGEALLCGTPRGQAPSLPAPPRQDPAAGRGHEVAPLTGEDWQTLYALDETYYGGWREQDLLYWLSAGPEFARLLRTDGRPSGYCLVEGATGRIGPAAAPTLDGFLALLDDALAALAPTVREDGHLSLRVVDPDAATLAALAARDLHPVPALRNVRMEKVYQRPIRRLRGLYASARSEKG